MILTISMFSFFSIINPVYFLFISIGGLAAGIFLFLSFIYRRIKWLLKIFSKEKVVLPGAVASLRNLSLIIIWTAVFSVLLLTSFFFRAYFAFAAEDPIAEIRIEPLAAPRTNRITLTQFVKPDSQITGIYLLKGDQWMLEGDVLKWADWLNFLGFRSRYRLTRIRGRYLRTQDEISRQTTVYPLTQDESHPVWQYLYQLGQQVPMVDAVYGNAVFQNSGLPEQFLIFISNSGFIVRKKVQS